MSIDNQLRDFIFNNKGKKIVAVQGLGFVGSVMSLVCANAINGDYSVLGVDLPTPKGKEIIDGLNNGVFPLIANDPKIKELFEATMKKKTNIKVTPRRKESQERMIKRFIKKCKKQGIIDEIKDRRYFKSNSEKKNEVKRKRKRAIAKAKEKGKR